jgi:hypothetical protein
MRTRKGVKYQLDSLAFLQNHAQKASNEINREKIAVISGALEANFAKGPDRR